MTNFELVLQQLMRKQTDRAGTDGNLIRLVPVPEGAGVGTGAAPEYYL